MSTVIIVSSSGVATPRVDYFNLTLEALRDATNEISYLTPARFDDWLHQRRFNERQASRRALIKQLEQL